jgi:hypothetical protein
MEPSRSITLTVRDAVAASLAPMWGQKSIWQWHGMANDDEAYFTNGQSFRVADHVPGGCKPDALIDALAQMVHRQDALRTTLDTSAGRLTGQVVHGDGELSVDVYEARPDDAESVAGAVAERMSGRPWTGREWPLRAALVVVDGSAEFLVMSHNRLVVDPQSLDFLMFDLAALITGHPEDALSHWQGVEETRYELSAERAEDHARAIDYWRSVLTACPPTMFDFPTGAPDDTRYVLAQMASVPLARAVRVLRRRWRATGGALVLGAMAVALGQYTGHRDIVLQMFAGNRTDRRRRRMLGTLISEGLIHIGLADRSFAAIATEATRSISAANRYAYCDPDAVRAVREEIERRTGARLDLAVYFNDMQTMQDAEQSELTAEEVANLVADGAALDPPESWPGWDESWQAKVTRKDIRLLLTAQHGHDLPLLLSCDTTYLSRDTMAVLLRAMERLLVAAARDGDVAAADLGRVAEVTPVTRGPSWTRCDGGWVDVAATRRLWRDVSPHGTVLVEPGDDRRLVGYVNGSRAPALDELHRRMLAAIGDRNDVRAPAWYRWVDAPPADPDDAEAWRGAAVLAEGPGR